MAQRASNVTWNGTYIFGSEALTTKPEHAMWVAATIAAWAATEQHLGRVFGSLIGAKQPVTMSMYAAVRSPEVQRDIIKTACAELLPKRYAMMAAAGLDALYKVSQPRHHFAHWLWGMSVDPAMDALLLVEPRHFWHLHTAQTRHFRKTPPPRIGALNFHLRTPRLNHDDIWVYKLSDLKDAHERMDHAFRIAEALNQLVSSSNAPRRRAIYQMLSAQPDVQTALRAVKKNWPKNRPARPAQPRKSPRKKPEA